MSADVSVIRADPDFIIIIINIKKINKINYKKRPAKLSWGHKFYLEEGKLYFKMGVCLLGQLRL